MDMKHYHIVIEIEADAPSASAAIAAAQSLLLQQDAIPADVYGEGKHERVAIQLRSSYSDDSVNENETGEPEP